MMQFEALFGDVTDLHSDNFGEIGQKKGGFQVLLKSKPSKNCQTAIKF